ncbi:unnamed protein product [Thelazia callipaeda]|uniref:GH97_N domain-containing protein n=1 Tax=Thelazia callipaeda TaxID=103827 RepID=A0A0N5D9M4_THECL|nr:unnamed protein product [Thelazia callipaeda]
MFSLTLITLLTALICGCHGGVSNIRAKPGQTVVLEFMESPNDIEAEFMNAEGVHDRKLIIKDGEITELATKIYGNRITYNSGNLTIQDMKESDPLAYHYHAAKYPHVLMIDLTE